MLAEIQKYRDVLINDNASVTLSAYTSFDVDLLLLLFSLEKLLVFCFEVAADVEDSPSKWEQSLSEYTRLILRDGEFVEAPVVKSDSLDLLQESVAILYAVYSCFLDSSDISLSPIKDRIEYRMKKLFGSIFDKMPSVMIETVIFVWRGTTPRSKNVLVFLELIAGCSHHVVLSCTFDALSARLPGSSKHKLVRKLFASCLNCSLVLKLIY